MRDPGPTAEVDNSAPPPRTLDSLVADLLEWIGPGSRPYSEVIEAWRTSCPRLPVWEDANDLHLVARHRRDDGVALVSVSATGRRRLREHREAIAGEI